MSISIEFVVDLPRGREYRVKLDGQVIGRGDFDYCTKQYRQLRYQS